MQRTYPRSFSRRLARGLLVVACLTPCALAGMACGTSVADFTDVYVEVTEDTGLGEDRPANGNLHFFLSLSFSCLPLPGNRLSDDLTATVNGVDIPLLVLGGGGCSANGTRTFTPAEQLDLGTDLEVRVASGTDEILVEVAGALAAFAMTAPDPLPIGEEFTFDIVPALAWENNYALVHPTATDELFGTLEIEPCDVDGRCAATFSSNATTSGTTFDAQVGFGHQWVSPNGAEFAGGTGPPPDTCTGIDWCLVRVARPWTLGPFVVP